MGRCYTGIPRNVLSVLGWVFALFSVVMRFAKLCTSRTDLPWQIPLTCEDANIESFQLDFILHIAQHIAHLESLTLKVF